MFGKTDFLKRDTIRTEFVTSRKTVEYGKLFLCTASESTFTANALASEPMATESFSFWRHFNVIARAPAPANFTIFKRTKLQI
jgi:hypothetical protein